MSSNFKYIGIVVVALVAVVGILLATTRNSNSETASENEFILSGNPTTTTDPAETPQTVAPTQTSEIIRGFLPQGGIGAACTESVGVLVAQGFAATLNINGRQLEDDELNVNLNADGSISDRITATRSMGQFSFSPESNCPNGELVRPTDNVLQVCVYRTSDATRSCVVQETFNFDAI